MKFIYMTGIDKAIAIKKMAKMKEEKEEIIMKMRIKEELGYGSRKNR